MKKKVSKTSDENELVTKDFLRQELEPFVTKDFLRQELERFGTKDFLTEQLSLQDKKLDSSVDIILLELANMRKENREMYQMREQLYTTTADQGFQITDHEERIHKLEIAR